MSQKPTYRKPVSDFEILDFVLKHPQDTLQYLELLALAKHLPQVRQQERVVPVIFLGLLDVEPHDTIANLYREWGLGQAGDVLLIAGQHAGADKRDVLTIEKIRESLPEGNEVVTIHSQIAADNTPEQARWLCEKVTELGINTVALHVPEFHGPRALATLIATMKELGVSFDALLYPHVLDPEATYQLAGFADVVKSIELILGELTRFINYRGGGVASHADVEMYIDQLKANQGID